MCSNELVALCNMEGVTQSQKLYQQQKLLGQQNQHITNLLGQVMFQFAWQNLSSLLHSSEGTPTVADHLEMFSEDCTGTDVD